MNASIFSKRPVVIGILAVACLVGVVNVIRSANSSLNFGTSTSSAPAQYKIVSAEEIYPAVANKTLSKRTIGLRPASDPAQVNTYCVHTYADGTEVNQFIGLSPANGPTLKCS